MPLRALPVALAFAVFCGRALASDVVGYSEAFDTLYRVDLTTRTAVEIGRATPIGGQRYAIIEGLTLSPTGQLYAVSDADAVKTLLQIDPSTGLATAVGTLSLTGGNVSQQLDLGLAFTCDGRMWMSSGPGMFWQVDPVSAAATYVGNLGVKVTGITAQGNSLYGAGSQGNNNLYRIDPTKATATLVGPYGAGVNYITVTSPAFDSSGKFWAVLDYVPPPNDTDPVAEWSDLAQVNPVSGALNNLGQITATGNSAEDLAFIGLRGLALPPSTCAARRPTDMTPALSWPGVATLIALVALLGGTRLTRRRLNA
jgi:hypothetical protein